MEIDPEVKIKKNNSNSNLDNIPDFIEEISKSIPGKSFLIIL